MTYLQVLLTSQSRILGKLLGEWPGAAGVAGEAGIAGVAGVVAVAVVAGVAGVVALAPP